MKISDKFVLRQVAGSWIVLPVAEKTVDFNGMLTLNETGLMLWKLLEKGSSREALAQALTDEYDVTFAEALADGAVECGVPRDKAATYAAQTILGAGKMLLEFGHPADLKDAVCSPGGTTIAGIHALETAGFRGAAMDAVKAAYKRTLELKK